MKNWMVYGVNGYSGQLIIERAVMLGMKPLLAGRNQSKVAALAEQYGLSYRIFSIDDIPVDALTDVDLVLNCAGPFSQTAKEMVSACLVQKCHYLDITGEIDVFEWVASQHATALQQGVILCPGVGFDVIPTDCLAIMLKKALPDATHLALGFDSRSGFSPGTAKTSVEALPQGGKIRVSGVLKSVPLAFETRLIDFGAGEKLAMTIPWGDVATAYRSTRIPNIAVYIPASQGLIKRLRRLNWIKWALSWSWVQNMLKANVDKKVKGPTKKQRDTLKTQVWGEVINSSGETKTMRMTVANGYQLTAEGAVYVVQQLLKGTDQAGYFTPGMLMGDQLIMQCSSSSEVH